MLARRKHPGSECVADCLLCCRNGRPLETPPGTVRNSDVGKNSHTAFIKRRRQERFVVNPHPTANLSVRVASVVRWPAKGVELSGFQGTNDELLVDGNAGSGKAAVGPPGKTVRKELRLHFDGDGPETAG